MKAIKENRQYTINDTDVQRFARDGYDVYDDDGNIVAFGVGKSVPFEKYAKAMEQIEKLQEEIIDLNAKIKSLEGKKKG